MKNSIITLLLFLFFIAGFSQNPMNEYNGRATRTVKKEKLIEAKFTSDIIPDYPKEYYNKLIDYVLVEISAKSNGKTVTTTSISDTLSVEQKNMLTTADLGTDIQIKINFKYKDPSNDAYGSSRKIKEMKFLFTAVPEIEAEYPGGYGQLTQYLKETVIEKIPEKSTPEKIPRVKLTFKVNEEGKIVDPKIIKSSPESKIDQLLLDAINNMPIWKPAQNSKGTKVNEEFEFSFPFGRGC